MIDTPRALGFLMPAEWERHEATWMAWPHNPDTWPGNLPAAVGEFSRLVQGIAEDEPVRVLASGAARDQARSAVRDWPAVELVDIATNDSWIRDYGPTFVVNRATGSLGVVDWNYNGWGMKYPPFDADQQVARRIAERLGVERWVAPITAEGGAIDVNSDRWLLSTRSCLLHENRNPSHSAADIDAALQDYCSARQMIWLAGDAICGDDTDGHIDQLARFVDDRTIVYAWTEDPQDPQRPRLSAHLDELAEVAGRTNPGVELVPLPLPEPVFFNGQRLPASYLNFYITNHSVWVPGFGGQQDARAAGILGELFDDRRVVTLPAVNLAVGLGSFHCLTQQQPAVTAG